jgi:hypothetical protein
MTDPVTLAVRGTVSKSQVTAVLMRDAGWISILPGTFDTCEINFYDEATDRTVGGVLGFRFIATGAAGRRALIFASMEAVSGVQMEEPEEAENVD